MYLSSRKTVHPVVHLFLVPGHGPGCDGFNADASAVDQLNY